MLAVPCPRVATGRGERLVTERRITALDSSATGFVLTVACPCGQPHQLHVGRLPAPPMPAPRPSTGA